MANGMDVLLMNDDYLHPEGKPVYRNQIAGELARDGVLVGDPGLIQKTLESYKGVDVSLAHAQEELRTLRGKIDADRRRPVAHGLEARGFSPVPRHRIAEPDRHESYTTFPGPATPEHEHNPPLRRIWTPPDLTNSYPSPDPRPDPRPDPPSTPAKKVIDPYAGLHDLDTLLKEASHVPSPSPRSEPRDEGELTAQRVLAGDTKPVKDEPPPWELCVGHEVAVPDEETVRHHASWIDACTWITDEADIAWFCNRKGNVAAMSPTTVTVQFNDLLKSVVLPRSLFSQDGAQLPARRRRRKTQPSKRVRSAHRREPNAGSKASPDSGARPVVRSPLRQESFDDIPKKATPPVRPSAAAMHQRVTRMPQGVELWKEFPGQPIIPLLRTTPLNKLQGDAATITPGEPANPQPEVVGTLPDSTVFDLSSQAALSYKLISQQEAVARRNIHLQLAL